MKLRLSAVDRERLGCPEWLDYDQDHLSLDDAEALEEAGGSYHEFFAPGAKAARARVWVALHRAGVTVTPYKSLTFDLVQMQFDGPVPGKAPSANGGPSTSSTSATSSRRSPRKPSKN